MNKKLPDIDLTDVYNDAYSQEIESYKRFVTVFIDQIFVRHFIEPGRLEAMSYHQLTDLDIHPSLTAYHFTRKILAYYLAQGKLAVNDDSYLSVLQPITDRDPEDKQLNDYLAAHPEKRSFYDILRRIRDVAGDVIFKGEDALLTLANDNFREAMQLWEDLMINAQVKRPCHQLIIRALKEKARTEQALRIFEGGAGVGSILRDGLKEKGFLDLLNRIERYYFTDVSLSLIKMGRENLREQLPPDIFERFIFRVADLDKLFINGAAFTRESSLDMIILEHVLYDVIDLEATLSLFHKILKPNGFLVFTMAFRTDPQTFFPFEYLQSTFQSYHKARLEEGFRNHAGYLSIDEWNNSLRRAGFNEFSVFPSPAEQIRWPYGGILAVPSK